ncbi:hypothetical protein X777_07392 [Ooceraea biroi]|uniref:Uncharacterized protein n=1 Tax=Ooceraea biroi TaxID=2015173 RepID=A0A026W9Z8_OOCBI|nr:hypothetical protein X777_07392 [Ooceraea biroi]
MQQSFFESSEAAGNWPCSITPSGPLYMTSSPPRASSLSLLSFCLSLSFGFFLFLSLPLYFFLSLSLSLSPLSAFRGGLINV